MRTTTDTTTNANPTPATTFVSALTTTSATPTDLTAVTNEICQTPSTASAHKANQTTLSAPTHKTSSADYSALEAELRPSIIRRLRSLMLTARDLARLSWESALTKCREFRISARETESTTAMNTEQTYLNHFASLHTNKIRRQIALHKAIRHK